MTGILLLAQLGFCSTGSDLGQCDVEYTCGTMHSGRSLAGHTLNRVAQGGPLKGQAAKELDAEIWDRLPEAFRKHIDHLSGSTRPDSRKLMTELGRMKPARRQTIAQWIKLASERKQVVCWYANSRDFPLMFADWYGFWGSQLLSPESPSVGYPARFIGMPPGWLANSTLQLWSPDDPLACVWYNLIGWDHLGAGSMSTKERMKYISRILDGVGLSTGRALFHLFGVTSRCEDQCGERAGGYVPTDPLDALSELRRLSERKVAAIIDPWNAWDGSTVPRITRRRSTAPRDARETDGNDYELPPRAWKQTSLANVTGPLVGYETVGTDILDCGAFVWLTPANETVHVVLSSPGAAEFARHKLSDRALAIHGPAVVQILERAVVDITDSAVCYLVWKPEDSSSKALSGGTAFNKPDSGDVDSPNGEEWRQKGTHVRVVGHVSIGFGGDRSDPHGVGYVAARSTILDTARAMKPDKALDQEPMLATEAEEEIKDELDEACPSSRETIVRTALASPPTSIYGEDFGYGVSTEVRRSVFPYLCYHTVQFRGGHICAEPKDCRLHLGGTLPKTDHSDGQLYWMEGCKDLGTIPTGTKVLCFKRGTQHTAQACAGGTPQKPTWCLNTKLHSVAETS